MLARWLLSVPIVMVGVSSASAEETALTLPRVIELARTRAPAAVIARARVDEERSALVGARRLSTRNPVIGADVGPRWSDGTDGTSTDARASLSVPLDLGGRRGKRVAVAEADIGREQLEAQNTERVALGQAVVAYYEVLHADRTHALAEERVRLAEAAEQIARQRSRAGDVAEFEVDLARGEVARARSSIASAKSGQTRARARLAAILGLDSVSVVGDLADRKLLEVDTKAPVRADLRALAQEAELGKAEALLARAQRWPSLDFRVTYEQESDSKIGLAGISIELPFFDRGQGDEARARARTKRAELELQLRTTVATIEVTTALNTYASSIEAVGILETDAVPLSVKNQTAATASYAAGKIELGSLLVIRREALDTRREHIDRLRDAALAAVDLWIARGAPLTSHP